MRPSRQVGGPQVMVGSRLGQEEGTRCLCLHIWGTQESD